MKKLFENLDPNGAILTFVYMMKKKIVMPKHLMYDGHNNHPFNDYGLVAQKTWGFTPVGTMLTSWTI
jgi:acyl-[acyl-carrier-protein] desaturase